VKNDLDVFKACSDATRLRILFLLAEKELCVCELLKHSGLVADRRDDSWVYYALRRSDSGLMRWLIEYLQSERKFLGVVADDLRKLDDLATAGEICVPRPSPGRSERELMTEPTRQSAQSGETA
jgi:ArsR family transcriptional regulator